MSIYNTLNEILRIPLNRRNWLWFKQYIFESSLFDQKVKISDSSSSKSEGNGNGKLLYHLLIEMVAKQLKAQKEYLEPYIDKLENVENKEDNECWDKLKNYKEFIVTDSDQGLRQVYFIFYILYSFINYGSDV